MTKEIATRIVKGITDKIKFNTIDIDDWAEFRGFTREEYEEFLNNAIETSEQEPKTGHWIFHKPFDSGHKNCNECIECSQCHTWYGYNYYIKTPYCPNCGLRMVNSEV